MHFQHLSEYFIIYFKVKDVLSYLHNHKQFVCHNTLLVFQNTGFFPLITIIHGILSTENSELIHALLNIKLLLMRHLFLGLYINHYNLPLQFLYMVLPLNHLVKKTQLKLNISKIFLYILFS